jgi:peptidase E
VTLGDAAEATAGKTADFAERRPHVAFSVLTLFSQPNVPDVRRHLLAQDVLFVEGGSVVNLLAVWRAHGLDRAARGRVGPAGVAGLVGGAGR